MSLEYFWANYFKSDFSIMYLLENFQKIMVFKEISNNKQANKTKITLALFTTIEMF